MTRITAILSSALLAVMLLSSAAAAELGGKWTTDGRYVFTFARVGAAWDEEVNANGGRAFRNTAVGTLTDSSLTISGAREGTGERAYRAELKRVP